MDVMKPGDSVHDGAGTRGVVISVETVPAVVGRSAIEEVYVDWNRSHTGKTFPTEQETR